MYINSHTDMTKEMTPSSGNCWSGSFVKIHHKQKRNTVLLEGCEMYFGTEKEKNTSHAIGSLLL